MTDPPITDIPITDTSPAGADSVPPAAPSRTGSGSPPGPSAPPLSDTAAGAAPDETPACPDHRRLLGMAGLARRAGKTITGADLICDGIRSGIVRLVLEACDAAPNTRKRIGNCCACYRVPLLGGAAMPAKEALTRALGRAGEIAAVGFTDAGFACEIIRLSGMPVSLPPPGADGSRRGSDWEEDWEDDSPDGRDSDGHGHDGHGSDGRGSDGRGSDGHGSRGKESAKPQSGNFPHRQQGRKALHIEHSEHPSANGTDTKRSGEANASPRQTAGPGAKARQQNGTSRSSIAPDTAGSYSGGAGSTHNRNAGQKQKGRRPAGRIKQHRNKAAVSPRGGKVE